MVKAGGLLGAAAAANAAGAANVGREYLKIDPPEGVFSPVPGNAQGPHVSHHKVLNQGQEKIALKIKCSDNKLYRLRPVFSMVEPGKDIALTVARVSQPPADKRDKLVFQFLFAKGAKADDTPQNVWKGAKGTPDGTLNFTLSGGSAGAAAPSVAATVASAAPAAGASLAGTPSTRTAASKSVKSVGKVIKPVGKPT